MRRRSLELVAAIALAAASPARAGEPSPWAGAPARPFLAWTAEAGTVTHLGLAAGWGKPWWLWGGLAADGWINETMGAVTAGARASLLAVDLDVHWRATRLWTRVPMAPLARHLAYETGGGSSTQALDLCLSGALPTPGGYALWDAMAVRFLGAPRGVHLADEALRAVVAPPWAGSVGAGWVADLRAGTLRAGGGVSWVFTGRGGTPLVRLGPQASWSLSPRWTLQGRLLVPVRSPDGFRGRDALAGGLVIGWRDATGREGPAAR